MKFFQAFFVITAIIVFPINLLADSESSNSASSKAFVMEALNEALVKGNPEVVPEYWAEDYIHNEAGKF